MCRIAGLINATIPVAHIKTIVQEMCSIQRHGGPDGEGIYCCEEQHLVFGHRRLALIDLSPGGKQPMHYDNNRYVITYNGELYNYPELKEQLKISGCTFSTTSDTEVILAAFATWGTEAFKQFNGMFALAILDNETGTIYLARDASGIKPLYYAHTKQGIAFASEIKAFKPIDYLQEAHPHWPVYLMAYGHLPEPVTTLKNVHPLKKGTCLQINLQNNEFISHSFEAENYREKIFDRAEAIEKIQQNLANAVSRHLISDAPIGVFLSGGLDSSIIASLANKKTDLKSVSLYFDDNNYSEKNYQDLVQQTLQTDQFQQLLKEDDFHNYLPDIIKAMDLPGCDGINTWFISKYAKENGLKAVLSGIGADELYGGYPSFKRMQTALILQQIPNNLLRASKNATSKRLRRLCYLSIPGAIGTYLFLRGQFIPSEIAQYLNMTETEIWKILEDQPQILPISNLSAENQASWIETNLYMQNQLLRDADVMSMAHGIELRVPFLDKDFVQLSRQIAGKIKYNGLLKKQLLIDSFKDIVPEQVWNRPKMGFSFPFRDWLIKDQYASDNLGTKNAAYHKKFTEGKLHWSQFLTIFLMENHAKTS